jgi:Family of unknown function (DUF5681)
MPLRRCPSIARPLFPGRRALFSDSTEGKQRNLIPFKPGQSGNPRGRPKGARNKLGEEFLTQLCEDFEAHGAAAIERVRQEDPAAYLRAIVSVLPKELKIDRRPDAGPLNDLTEHELRVLLYAARNAVRFGTRWRKNRDRKFKHFRQSISAQGAAISSESKLDWLACIPSRLGAGKSASIFPVNQYIKSPIHSCVASSMFAIGMTGSQSSRFPRGL